MPDWTKSMEQTFEFCVVDPDTWLDESVLDCITSASVSFDKNAESFATAKISATESIGEEYIRIYLVAIQGGVRERFPLGVFLVQTPQTSFDGKVQKVEFDCYSPLIELKEKLMPIGYYLRSNVNVIDTAIELLQNNMRCPVLDSTSTVTLEEPFVADISETVMEFVQSLLDTAGCSLRLDDMGQAVIEDDIDVKSLKPVYIFDDGNSSILKADISVDRDLYGIPNRVEAVRTNAVGYSAWGATNTSPDSPVSTVNRGRRIVERIVDPDTNLSLSAYAEQYLREVSCLEYTVSFEHGYVPNIRVGDCVRLNYSRAGLQNVDVKIIAQEINCTAGCTIKETAVITIDLMEAEDDES